MQHLRELSSFVKPYWKQSVLALILLCSVVLMDLAVPRLIQLIIDQGIGENDMQLVIRTSFFMVGISILSALFAVGNNILSVQVGEAVARDLREALFLRIQSFSYGNLDQLKTGQLMVRLTSDVNMLTRVVRVLLRIGTRAPLLMIGSLILMVSTSTNMALTISPLLLITGFIMVFFIVKMGSLFLVSQQKLDKLNTVLQENIAGVRVVKAFVRKQFESQRFADANEEFTLTTIDVMQVMAALMPTLMACINIGVVVLVWAGGYQVASGDLSIGEIVAFTNYLLTTMTPLMIMARLSSVMAGGIASAERVQEVLTTTPEIQDQPNSIPIPSDTDARIVFEKVSFDYNGASTETVLEDISFIAEPGQIVAILGATGSGKTSLINLIPRFYDAAEGHIKFDSYNVREFLQDSLLSQISIVPQESILFSGTLRENIRYGNPDAPEEDIIAVAKVAQVHEFIMQLPEKFDTHIEHRGINLSGGQKQRIAIARALLTRPKILILDDSTSSVDVETEGKIQISLREWLQDCTTFIVAQRISTVLNADKIIVLDMGKIVAQGTHTELLQSSPIYQEIYDSQLGDGMGANNLKADGVLRDV